MRSLIIGVTLGACLLSTACKKGGIETQRAGDPADTMIYTPSTQDTVAFPSDSGPVPKFPPKPSTPSDTGPVPRFPGGKAPSDTAAKSR